MDDSEATPEQVWRRVEGVWVRADEFRPAGQERATVVLLPGLGLPRYTFGTARAMAALGLRCVVVDALAWRGPAPRVRPSVVPLGETAARWVEQSGLTGPLVVVGHSTGAQAALAAGIRLQARRSELSVVLAGLTFQPGQRTVRGLLRGAATAYSRDTPRELVVVARNVLRVRGDVLRLIESGRHDSPEARVARLRVPLTLTAGEQDSFAPEGWMRRVADASGGPSARVVTLPGSHNNLFTHAEEFAALVAGSISCGGGEAEAPGGAADVC